MAIVGTSESAIMTPAVRIERLFETSTASANPATAEISTVGPEMLLQCCARSPDASHAARDRQASISQGRGASLV
jgi:hypothetical protein